MERRRRARQGFSGKGDVRLIAQWKAGCDKRTFFLTSGTVKPGLFVSTFFSVVQRLLSV